MRRNLSLLIIGLCATGSFAQQPVATPQPKAPTAREDVPADQPPVKRVVYRPTAVSKLAWRFREVSFQDMPLQDVFEHIGRTLNTNIVVRWNRLADAGLERDTAVSLAVRNMRVSQILWLIFNQLSTDGGKLAYRADRDMILISTADDLDAAMIVRVYDIEDLIANRIARPEFRAERVRTAVTGVVPNVAPGAVGVAPITTDYGSGVYINSDDAGADNSGNDEDFDQAGDQDRQRRIRELVDAITASVEPDTWAVNGGRGSVMPFRGMLVVRNSPLVHQLLGGPLSERDAAD